MGLLCSTRRSVCADMRSSSADGGRRKKAAKIIPPGERHHGVESKAVVAVRLVTTRALSTK